MKLVQLIEEVKTQQLTKESANILVLILVEIQERGIEEVHQ